MMEKKELYTNNSPKFYFYIYILYLYFILFSTAEVLSYLNCSKMFGNEPSLNLIVP